ncbi:uracil phosphoribosyltransferase [Scytonema hofmannii PCC 7110]|uniref:Uracil phosphoribosyltransferase n=1 Tax=Scytonema hofmannii PCC 7110 TaxID=128403 RepID=A0A139WVG2_9CYAN|nr:URC4/urg3 family protein [Scytonema hofmannii]KYC36426.1 uracil phosphoribosyltransferase [Scytonema hofmannii PCC 7110]
MEKRTAETLRSQRKDERALAAYLRSPTAIRERCGQLYKLAIEGNSRYFNCDLSQLERVADYTIGVMREEYPDLGIPFHSRWRHFETGGVPRLSILDERLAGLTPLDKAIAKFDLVIISVLLDAGAGESWYYNEPETQLRFQRSEGLAVASFQMFCTGTFVRCRHTTPLQVNADRLQTLTEGELAQGFGVSAENPLVGITGRLKLLQKLGRSLVSSPNIFGEQSPRPGNLVRYLMTKSCNNQLEAATVLGAVLEGLSDIWSGRIEVAGINLGDVWFHPDVVDDGLVPFHKLSQWLTYSLLEPLEELGLEITGLDALTGLAEYRNGGLFLDLGLINVKNQDILLKPYPVSSEAIVEWRALTVILLDCIAATIREKLGMNAEELPLVKILQGGTWTAGRRIAAELRKGATPPIQIESDGTVF